MVYNLLPSTTISRTFPAVALIRTQIWLKDVTWQGLADWLIELKQLLPPTDEILDTLNPNITNILKEGGKIGLDKPTAYSYPYHWAAFTITGRG